MSQTSRAATMLSVTALVLLLVAGFGRVAAQDSTPVPDEDEIAVPTPLPAPVSAFVEVEATVDELPAGPATISVSTVIISPRVALRAIVTNGPVVILVDSGTLTIDADAAIIGEPPVGSMTSLQPAATPGPAQVADFLVPDGSQIMLPAGTRVQLRNTTDEEVELVVTTITPVGEERFGQPSN